MNDAPGRLEAVGVVPEALLRRALEAPAGTERAHYALLGLSLDPLDPDTEVLLLRQLYRANLELGDLKEALATARRMTTFDSFRDISHHDTARVLAALGDLGAAIREQRSAARAADPERRSFQLWSLATLEHFDGQDESALITLARAKRWATADRTLIDAHAAYIEVARGKEPDDLSSILDRLGQEGLRGYRLYLRGMIAYHRGSEDLSRRLLRRWLRQHATADPAKALTLREECCRAQRTVATLS